MSTIDHWLDEDRQVRAQATPYGQAGVRPPFGTSADLPAAIRSSRITCASVIKRHREVFVPLSHPAGHAQADFGEAMVVIGGVERKAHFFVLDLPHSDGCYVRALYPAAVSEAWVDGPHPCIRLLRGVPQSIVYDNDRLPGGEDIARWHPRKRATLFSGFLSHYLIPGSLTGRPGKGNDKGSVEGLVGYARRNFMVPIPQFATWEAFNAWLEEQCRKQSARQAARRRARRSGNACCAIWPAMRPLPASPFDACDQSSAKVTAQSLVRYKTNDYSVPVALWPSGRFGVRGYVDEVVIGCRGEIIARHPRSWEREDVVFDPVHYPAADRAEDQLAGSGGTSSGLGFAGRVRHAAPADGGADEQAWPA